MSSRRVKPWELADAIDQILIEYEGDVIGGTRKAITKVSEKVKDEVKEASPVGPSWAKKRGRYAKGWAVKELGSTQTTVHTVIHNRTDYQLAHLLEKGHILAHGGQYDRRSPARVHIAPAEQHAEKYMEEAIKRIAQEG